MERIINYQELKFEHIVVFNQEESIFATARENGSGRTRIFLIFSNGRERVYTRNGLAESWEILKDEDANTVREHIHQELQSGIAVYRINGSSKGIAGEAN